MPVTLEQLEKEVAAHMREKGMDPFYVSVMKELIEIGWKRAEKCNSD